MSSCQQVRIARKIDMSIFMDINSFAQLFSQVPALPVGLGHGLVVQFQCRVGVGLQLTIP